MRTDWRTFRVDRIQPRMIWRRTLRGTPGEGGLSKICEIPAEAGQLQLLGLLGVCIQTGAGLVKPARPVK
jgi:hypothetical protein